MNQATAYTVLQPLCGAFARSRCLDDQRSIEQDIVQVCQKADLEFVSIDFMDGCAYREITLETRDLCDNGRKTNFIFSGHPALI